MTLEEKIQREVKQSTGQDLPFDENHLDYRNELRDLFYRYTWISDGWWAGMLGISRVQVRYIKTSS